jgi:hypothetical protein
VTGYTLDAGALIAAERGDRPVVARLARAVERNLGLAVPAGALGQVWRDGRRQVVLRRLLAAETVTVVPIDDRVARASGQLCGVAGTADVIDASVVLCARERAHAVLTTDAEDLRALDPGVPIIPVG